MTTGVEDPNNKEAAEPQKEKIVRLGISAIKLSVRVIDDTVRSRIEFASQEPQN